MVWSARGLGRTGSGFGLTSAALGGRRLRTPGGGGLSGPRRSAGPSRSRRAGTVGGTPGRQSGSGRGWRHRCDRLGRRHRFLVALRLSGDATASGGALEVPVGAASVSVPFATGRTLAVVVASSSTGDPELGCPRAVSGPRSTEPGASRVRRSWTRAGGRRGAARGRSCRSLRPTATAPANVRRRNRGESSKSPQARASKPRTIIEGRRRRPVVAARRKLRGTGSSAVSRRVPSFA